VVPEDVRAMQEELGKLRSESKQLKQRAKQETDARKHWQEKARKREEDLANFKD
jgi:phage shock protein A